MSDHRWTARAATPAALLVVVAAAAGCASDGSRSAPRADSTSELTLAPAHDSAPPAIRVGRDAGLPPAPGDEAPTTSALRTTRTAAGDAPAMGRALARPTSDVHPVRQVVTAPPADVGVAARAPAPPAPPPAPPPVLAPGSTLVLGLETRLCGVDLSPGAQIAAGLREAVTGPDGTTLPVGSQVILVVGSVESGQVRLASRTIRVANQSYPLEGMVGSPVALDTAHANRTRRGLLGGLGGALAGAALGVATGRDTKAAVIGAAAGAAAGTAVGAATTPGTVCTTAGQSLTLHVTSALRVPAA